MRFLAELMAKNKGVIIKEGIQYTVVSGAQFPYTIPEVFRNIFRKAGAILLQKLNVENCLLILYTGIFICGCFLPQCFKKFPNDGLSVAFFIEFDCIHS